MIFGDTSLLGDDAEPAVRRAHACAVDEVAVTRACGAVTEEVGTRKCGVQGRVDLIPKLAFPVLKARLREHPVSVPWPVGEQLTGVRLVQGRHSSRRPRWTPH